MNNRFVSHYMTESWGSSILIMERTGKAFGRAYWYNDDNATIYLDMLSVDVDIRKNGLGTELQEIREQIGRNLGATTSCLWVNKKSWMYTWYKRRGYEDYKEHEEENCIWMRKSLQLQ